MNGAHDLGGMHGFEPINADPNDPLFHAEWERRTLALTLACGFLGKWNIDMSRFAREQMPPGAYLESSDYEHWLFGLEKLLLEQGLVTREELAAGRAKESAPEGTAVSPEGALEIIAEGGSYQVDEEIEAKFAVGTAVRTRNSHPLGHTRIPRYARGRLGVIERHHGVFVFPDANAIGEGPAAQHLYTVRFTARELWGEVASAHDSISLDLWDDYLEKA